MQRTPHRPALTPGEASLVRDGTSGGGGGRGAGHATELPGRGQYGLSEKLRARTGNRPRCETYSIPQSSVSGRARPAAGIFRQRARGLGTGERGLKAPRPPRGLAFSPRALLALRAASGLGRWGRSRGPLPALRARVAGPSPGLGRFQDADSALAAHPRGLGLAPAAPQRRTHSLKSPGIPGSRSRLETRGPQGLLQAAGARPAEAGLGGECGRARTPLSGIDCSRWGREAAN